MGKPKLLLLTFLITLIPYQTQATLYKNYSKQATTSQKNTYETRRRAYINKLQIENVRAKAKYKKDLKKAKAKNLPIRVKTANGGIKSFAGFNELGMPMYYKTFNLESAQLSNVDQIWTDPPGLDGTGITIGVWDDGPALTSHQELTGRVTKDDSVATSATGEHGTWVTGVIISKGEFLEDAKGMAHNGNAVSYTFDSKSTTAIIAEMQDALTNDNIILSNHSYGFITGWDGLDDWTGFTAIDQDEDFRFGFYLDAAEKQDEFVHNNDTAIVVKAAGNDRGDFSSSTHDHSIEGIFNQNDTHEADGGADGFDSIPGDSTAKNLIIVGATNQDGETMASFSGFGPADDGRIKPDISAKGVNFITTHMNANNAYTSSSGFPNRSPVSGTSFSAPTVTGIIALLLEHQENLNPGSSLLASTIKALILHTANDIENPGPDYKSGWGFINAKAAVDQMNLDETISGNILEGELSNSETITFNIVISANTNAKATMVWTDPEGNSPTLFASPSTLDPDDPMLVNDLDLRVSSLVTPAAISLPWVLDKDNPDNHATKGDNTLDNIEQVIIPTASIAIPYQVEITHKGTLSAAQKFSLMQKTTTTPSTVNISLSTTNITLNDTLTLNSTVLPTETSQFVVWSIDEGAENAGISSGNILVPSDNGSVVVRASALGFEEVFATANIEICAQVLLTGINITSTNNVKLLSTLSLTADLAPESPCHQLSWELIDGEELATINNEDTLVPSAIGTVIVQASVENSAIIATQSITILHADPTNLTIELTTTNITTDDSPLTLNATVEPPQANQCVIWSLDSGNGVTANITGSDPFFLDPIDGGIVTIRARACSNNAITDTEQVTIIISPESVDINLPTNNLVLGNTMNLVASVLPSGANQTVEWILESGLSLADIILPDTLRAGTESTGSVTLKAFAEGTRGSNNEIFATANVNIILPNPESLEITIENTNITASQNRLLTAEVSPNNASQMIIWSISEGNEIASITGSGSGPFNLVPSGTGNITILAQALGFPNVSDNITITIDPPPPPALSITKFTNGPNPFNPENGTTIFIELTKASKVTLQLYGLNRKRLWSKNLGTITETEFNWDGKNKYGQDLANGIYILFIIAEDSNGTKIIEKRKIGVLR